MNKKKLVFCMGIALSSIFSTTSFAAVTGNGSGVVHFTGLIQDATCGIQTGDDNQTVNLGTVSKSEFKNIGSTTAGVRFSVHLIDCPAGVASNGKVALRFDGSQDSTNNDLLKVSTITSGATGSNPAAGVGIGIYNLKSNTKLPLFKDSDQESIDYKIPSKGTANFDFLAKYVSTATTVTSGPADADAFFTIAYN